VGTSRFVRAVTATCIDRAQNTRIIAPAFC
jgi:hypothetical protein